MVEDEKIAEVEALIAKVIPNLHLIKNSGYDLLECISPITLVAAIYVVERQYNIRLYDADMVYENFESFDSLIRFITDKIKR